MSKKNVTEDMLWKTNDDFNYF